MPAVENHLLRIFDIDFPFIAFHLSRNTTLEAFQGLRFHETSSVKYFYPILSSIFETRFLVFDRRYRSKESLLIFSFTVPSFAASHSPHCSFICTQFLKIGSYFPRQTQMSNVFKSWKHKLLRWSISIPIQTAQIAHWRGLWQCLHQLLTCGLSSTIHFNTIDCSCRLHRKFTVIELRTYYWNQSSKTSVQKDGPRKRRFPKGMLMPGIQWQRFNFLQKTQIRHRLSESLVEWSLQKSFGEHRTVITITSRCHIARVFGVGIKCKFLI